MLGCSWCWSRAGFGRRKVELHYCSLGTSSRAMTRCQTGGSASEASKTVRSLQCMHKTHGMSGPRHIRSTKTHEEEGESDQPAIDLRSVWDQVHIVAHCLVFICFLTGLCRSSTWHHTNLTTAHAQSGHAGQLTGRVHMSCLGTCNSVRPQSDDMTTSRMSRIRPSLYWPGSR